jgi:hypothetical protein
MPKRSLKRLFIWLGGFLTAVMVLLVALGLVLEAKFRPAEHAPITVPAGSGYLEGKVSEPTGWIPFVLPGIAGAEVSLTPGGQNTTTDADGVFAIPEIEPGVHTVTIAADGFETAVIEGVAITGGRITTLPDEALFPEITGPPKARLKVGSPMPFQKPPDAHPYLTTVYLDASDSENISRDGIRFEIRDAQGSLLMNPYAGEDQPLQLERSPNPGTSPALFLFQPPAPGAYTVKIILTNGQAPGVEDSAQATVRAVNIAPEAVPMVMAGPNPPRKMPTPGARPGPEPRLARTLQPGRGGPGPLRQEPGPLAAAIRLSLAALLSGPRHGDPNAGPQPAAGRGSGAGRGGADRAFHSGPPGPLRSRAGGRG